MYDLLRLFKTGRSHMVMLTKPTSATGKQRRTKPLQAKPELQVVRPLQMQGPYCCLLEIVHAFICLSVVAGRIQCYWRPTARWDGGCVP